jgi:hypothetical protein
MAKNLKIIVIDKPIAGDPQDPSRPQRISRFKFTLFSILAAALAFGALAIALLVGSVFAVALGSILILATLVAFLKVAFSRR